MPRERDDENYGLSIPGVSSPQVKKKETYDPGFEAVKRIMTTRNPKAMAPKTPVASDSSPEIARAPQLQQAQPFAEDYNWHGNDFVAAPSVQSAETGTPDPGAVTETPIDKPEMTTGQKLKARQDGNAQPGGQRQVGQGLVAGPLADSLKGQQQKYIDSRMEQVNDFALLNPKLSGRAAEQRVMEDQVQRQNGNFGANSGIVSALVPGSGTRGNANAMGLRVNEDPNVTAEVPQGPQGPIEIIRGNPRSSQSFNTSYAQQDPATGGYVERTASEVKQSEVGARSASLAGRMMKDFGDAGSIKAFQELYAINPKGAEAAARLAIASKKGNDKGGSELDAQLIASGIPAAQIAIMSEDEKLDAMLYGAGAPQVDTTSEFVGGADAKGVYFADMYKLMAENPDKYGNLSPAKRDELILAKWAESQ